MQSDHTERCQIQEFCDRAIQATFIHASHTSRFRNCTHASTFTFTIVGSTNNSTTTITTTYAAYAQANNQTTYAAYAQANNQTTYQTTYAYAQANNQTAGASTHHIDTNAKNSDNEAFLRIHVYDATKTYCDRNNQTDTTQIHDTCIDHKSTTENPKISEMGGCVRERGSVNVARTRLVRTVEPVCGSWFNHKQRWRHRHHSRGLAASHPACST